MNKKELAELRKNFSDESGFFTVNHVLRAFVDADKNIQYRSHMLYSLMPQEEREIILETLKKAISGSLGKTAVEYPFPNEQYEVGGAQHILYHTLEKKLLDDEQNEEFLKMIAGNVDYPSTFAIFAAHCTYSVLNRDKNEEQHEVADRDFNFMVTALCPVELGEDVLIYDDEQDSIYKKHNVDRLISRAPKDGFMYPVFSDNAADINDVLYYCSKAKEPNLSVIENVLGCEFGMTAKDEKETFQAVLGEVMGEDLSYTVITQVNEKIRDEIQESKFDERPAEIDDIKLRDILCDVGVDHERLETVHEIFKDKAGGRSLTATNLVSSRTVVATPEITVNIAKDATDKVRTSLIGGRRCLVIDLDDPEIVVNGLPTTIEFPEPAKEPQTV